MRFALPLLLLACGKPETDEDGDGFSAPADCDDHDHLVHPEAIEQCDELDNDCDDEIDEGLSHAFWVDADDDGFGGSTSDLSCSLRPGLVEQQGDCDDSNADVHPGAEELCNGIDDDCDGENPQAVTWYADADDDGFGDPEASMSTCEDSPDGHVLDNTDCDDGNELANPDENELCSNDFDDDCDGITADGTDPDGDGFLHEGCPDGLDCNDDDPGIHPDAFDVCANGVDEDCSGADAFCGFDGEFDLADAGAILTTETPKAAAGSLLGVGDMNGDGLDDVLAAAVGINGGFFVAGPIAGTTTFEAVGHELSGVEVVGAGQSIGVGDADGDGLDDAAFGAPYGDLTGQFVVYGPITADVDLDTESDASLLGTPGTFSGHGSDLADIDGDGIADGIVGSFAEDASAGTLYVEYGPLTGNVDLSGEADASIDSAVAESVNGRVIHAGIDLDGDGIGDLAANSIGESKAAGWFAGGVFVVSGPVSISTLEDAVFVAGPMAYAYAGESFALGDYDGDGMGDIAAWCSGGFHTGGGVNVMSGPLKADANFADAGVILESDSAEDFVGKGIGSGDFDLDGINELLIGAPGDDEASLEAGATYLVADPPSGTSEIDDVAQAVFLGATTGDESGMATATAQLDGIEYAEMVLGGPGMAEGGGLSVVFAEF
jgi:hypothetical protein